MTLGISRCIFTFLFPLKAEERLQMVEAQRKMEEERLAFEKEQKRRIKQEQEVILNKKKARPKLSFGFKAKTEGL